MSTTANTVLSRHIQQNKLTRSMQLIRRLYHKTEAKHISQSYRKEKQIANEDDKSLTYGEVEAASFMQILALTTTGSPIVGRKFVDLGCGAGLPCVCAAMSPYGFTSIVGIEIVEGLVDLAEALQLKLIDAFNQKSSNVAIPEKSNKKNVGVEVDLLPIVEEIMKEHPIDNPKPVDGLASEVCNRIGHKIYKVSIKKHKSFLKLLQSHSGMFGLDADGKQVWSVKCAQISSDEINTNVCEGDSDLTQEELRDVEKPLIIEPKDRELFLPLPHIEYIKGSIFEINWWDDVDVAYTASLLFSESMMETLLQCVLRMKADSWFITLKPLPLEPSHKGKVVLVDESFFKMSWQMAKVYTYRIKG